MESARICFCRWLVPHHLLVAFFVFTSPPLKHPLLSYDVLRCVLCSLFSKMPSHQIQTHCGDLMLTPLPLERRPQMQWCFRYWGLERYQEFEETLLSIGGTLVFLTHGTQLPIWALFPLVISYNLLMCPGPRVLLSWLWFPFDHYVLQRVLRAGWGDNSRATEMDVWFSAPVL